MHGGEGSAESFEDKRRQPRTGTAGHVAPESLARSHEVQEVSLRPLLAFTGGLTLVLIVIGLALWGVIGRLTGGQVQPEIQLVPAAVTPAVAPGPGIQSDPAGERRKAVAAALERINSYGWVDEQAGVVHIPIEEAMQRLAEQGLPADEGEPPSFFNDGAYELDGSGGRGVAR
jgi:hypothetical protein